MKKKARELKKHYRNVERAVRIFDLDLSDESWYSLWHTHLDRDGLTSISLKHRKIHIQYYLEILEKIERLTIGSKKKFQTWIMLGNEGFYDAIYFHTQNPQTDFPYKLDNIKWDVEIPSMFVNLLDLSKFCVGRIEHEDGYSYIIQKKGLGQDISN